MAFHLTQGTEDLKVCDVPHPLRGPQICCSSVALLSFPRKASTPTISWNTRPFFLYQVLAQHYLVYFHNHSNSIFLNHRLKSDQCVINSILKSKEEQNNMDWNKTKIEIENIRWYYMPQRQILTYYFVKLFFFFVCVPGW